MEIKEWQKKIHENSVKKGFWGDKKMTKCLYGNDVPAKLCLIHSEISEAMEAYRNSDVDNFKEELADMVIRVFDLAEGLGIDIEKEIEKKHEYNLTREYLHGKRC